MDSIQYALEALKPAGCIEVVRALVNGPLTVKELERATGMSNSRVNYALKPLGHARLVVRHKRPVIVELSCPAVMIELLRAMAELAPAAEQGWVECLNRKMEAKEKLRASPQPVRPPVLQLHTGGAQGGAAILTGPKAG